MTHTLTIGDVTIVSVPDGAGYVPSTMSNGWLRYRDAYPDMFREDGSWDIHNGCYVVLSGERRVLVDTGMGPWPYKRYGGVRGRLMGSLDAAGITPGDIDTVFLTHGHPDHVGWNVLDSGELAFPNARYLLHRADWSEFTGRERVPNYVARSLQPVFDAGRLDLLDGETAIAEGATALETPGHTPGHMSLLLSCGGEGAVVTGDTFPNPVYISEPESEFGADLDHERSAASRLALLARIEGEGLRVIAGHFHEPGFGTVVRVEGKRYWRAL